MKLSQRSQDCENSRLAELRGRDHQHLRTTKKETQPTESDAWKAPSFRQIRCLACHRETKNSIIQTPATSTSHLKNWKPKEFKHLVCQHENCTRENWKLECSNPKQDTQSKTKRTRQTQRHYDWKSFQFAHHSADGLVVWPFYPPLTHPRGRSYPSKTPVSVDSMRTEDRTLNRLLAVRVRTTEFRWLASHSAQKTSFFLRCRRSSARPCPSWPTPGVEHLTSAGPAGTYTSSQAFSS